MRTKTFLSIVGAAAALGTGAVAATGATADSSSPPASAAAQAGRFVRHIEGPIVAIDRASRSFTVRDREHRNVLATVKVTPKTRFDGVAGPERVLQSLSALARTLFSRNEFLFAD